MKKTDENKKEKEEKMLDTAFNLFSIKGFKETSIQDIVDNAGVAKGTFYLYFKDKYDIQNKLIAKKSQKLFDDALIDLKKNYIENFEDQIVFIINHVIDTLNKNHILLKLISKNLSFGIYNRAINQITDLKAQNENSIYSLFMEGVKRNNINLENPEISLFMIIELASSSAFNSILYNRPVPIEELKPLLFKEIRNILRE